MLSVDLRIIEWSPTPSLHGSRQSWRHPQQRRRHGLQIPAGRRTSVDKQIARCTCVCGDCSITQTWMVRSTQVMALSGHCRRTPFRNPIPCAVQNKFEGFGSATRSCEPTLFREIFWKVHPAACLSALFAVRHLGLFATSRFQPHDGGSRRQQLRRCFGTICHMWTCCNRDRPLGCSYSTYAKHYAFGALVPVQM